MAGETDGIKLSMVESNPENVQCEGVDSNMVSVPFVHQCYNWDCGLACVSMILQMLGEPCDDVYTKDLDAVQCGESVWTIDLAFILHRHNVHLAFYTITIGVHESHKTKSFYKSFIAEDSHRVKRMFDQAPLSGLTVEKRSVSSDHVISHLGQGHPIIALVNHNLLACVWCHSVLKKCWTCLSCGCGSFQGHYVVVCGYDRRKQLMYYRDPGCNAHDLCCMTLEHFDKARLSDGTDEDILFIYSHCNTVDMREFAVNN